MTNRFDRKIKWKSANDPLRYDVQIKISNNMNCGNNYTNGGKCQDGVTAECKTKPLHAAARRALAQGEKSINFTYHFEVWMIFSIGTSETVKKTLWLFE